MTESPCRGYKAARGTPEMPDAKAAAPAPFWRTKSMGEMTRAEWESLCDGCGRCCLNKLIDEDTNRTVFTDVGCRLLDGQTCRCTDYAHRQAKVKDCVRLTPRNVRRLNLAAADLRLQAGGGGARPLLVAPVGFRRPGDGARSRRLGARTRLGDEKDVPDEKLEEYIVAWPGKIPKAARAPKRGSR